MSTVIGVFRDVKTAEEAVRALRNKGFKDNEISIVAKEIRINENVWKLVTRWAPILSVMALLGAVL